MPWQTTWLSEVNIDFSKHAPKKYQPFEYDVTEPSKPGAEHVQESLFNMADEKDY